MNTDDSGSSVDSFPLPKKSDTKKPVAAKHESEITYNDPSSSCVKCLKLCCCCRRDPVTDAELRQLLLDGTTRKGDGKAKEKEASELYERYRHLSDGCSESGYFSRSRRVGPSAKSMEALRRTCRATENLPCPLDAIKVNNKKDKESGLSKAMKQKPNKKHKGEETNMADINTMIKSRLNGSIMLQTGIASEEGEALVTATGDLFSPADGADMTSMVLSQLVQESDARRMSFTSSDISLARRKSSISRRSVELSDARALNQLRQLNVENQSDNEFINRLPLISKMVKHELEKDWNFTYRYVKTLERYCKAHTFSAKARKTTERWMVLLYTTSEESDPMTHFNCLLVRLILQHHCVAYDERDVALKKSPYKAELQARQEKPDLVVPYVFANEIAIGGCPVIFALHKLKLMKVIFGNYIMTRDNYAEWQYSKIKNRSSLMMDMKITAFPALRNLLETKEIAPLTKVDRARVNQGKEVISKARKDWSAITRQSFSQPRLTLFILLKNTIIMSLTILNSIYLSYLSKRKKRKGRCPCC